MSLPAVIDASATTETMARNSELPWRAYGSAIALIIVADRLLFDIPPGISFGLFLLLLAISIPFANGWSVSTASRRFAGIPVLLTTLLPMFEAVNALTVTIGLCGFGLFAVVVSGNRGSLWQTAGQTLLLLLGGPVRLPGAVSTAVRHAGKQRPKTASLLHWLLPICIGLVFIVLLQSANPIIERWIEHADLLLLALFEILGFCRIVFWLAIAAFCWPFLQLHLSRDRPSRFVRMRAYFGINDRPEKPSGSNATTASDVRNDLWARIVAPVAITRSLVLFNVVFAIQSALDLYYLWGGADLPDGMTYASYAHRGAYPLVATALLAGGFVLLALRPGSGMEARPLTRNMILLFAAQNVLLVVSSILRLDLYVAEYSLTQLRLAALVWMALVAFGLALIVLRVLLRRTNRWLIDWNLRASLAALYACGLVNTTGLIANYNVDHAYELTGRGTRLDTGYLLCLGAAAIPALDRFVAEELVRVGFVDPALRQQIQDAAIEFDISMDHWQSWTFRRARLMQYLKSAGHIWP